MMIQAEPRKDGYMNVLQVIEVIQQLSHSQGFYCRLLETILDMHQNDMEQFEHFKEVVEAQNFRDPVDVVLYFES